MCLQGKLWRGFSVPGEDGEYGERPTNAHVTVR
jgi:hypothetical protein